MNSRPLRNKENVKLCNWNDSSEAKDVYIYKIIPYKYLLKWIHSNNIRFDQILTAWDDVYELFLFKQEYKRNGGDVDVISAGTAIYGQSWSLEGESDALWRIYSPDKLSVKIKVSVKKLVELLGKSNAMQQSACVYFGKVEYLNEKRIISKIKNEYVPDLFKEETIVNSLFVKRDNFKYENEIRIILWKEYNKDCPRKNQNDIIDQPQDVCLPNVQPYLNLDIHPADIIEEVEIDFRLDDNLSRAFSCSLQNLLPNAIVKKSSLGTIKKNTYKL